METNLELNIKILNNMIIKANKIVFFGGAGVSTESNIPDFRSASGIFTSNLSAEQIVSHTCFVKNPELFYEFYKSKMMYLDAKPNMCHIKLAKLEKKKNLTIITQNIDGLHQKAGSKNVIELHGTIHKNHCVKCHKAFDAAYVKNYNGVPKCDFCNSIIKPDVVLYEEALDYANIENAINALEEADLLIVGGTSLKVYPAASLIDFCHAKNKVLINLNDNPRQDYLYFNCKIGELFSKLEF